MYTTVSSAFQCFVGDRKIDEELATSDRFIGDCQNIIEVGDSLSVTSLFSMIIIIIVVVVIFIMYGDYYF